MGDAVMTAEMRQEFAENEVKEQLKNVTPEYEAAMKQALLIPLRTRTQYPLYLEARALTMVRAIAEHEGISAQDIIRDAVDAAIETRTRKERRKKRKATKKRS